MPSSVLNFKKKLTLENMQDIDGLMYLLLMSITAQLFRWENLPDDIKPHIVEEILFQYGAAVFFNVGGHYICLPASNQYDLNMYGEMVKVRPIGLNGSSMPERYIHENWVVKGETAVLANPVDAVLIKNNLQTISTWAFLTPFIDRLVYTWQSMGINQALATRLSGFIHANKDNSGAIYAALNSVLGGKSPLKVISEKDNTLEGISSVNVGVEYTPEKFWHDFSNTLDLIYTILGVNNKMAVEKKERLITSEVEMNQASVQLFRDSMYQFRKEAVEEINALFGLNIKVFATYEALEDETSDATLSAEDEAADAKANPVTDAATEQGA